MTGRREFLRALGAAGLATTTAVPASGQAADAAYRIDWQRTVQGSGSTSLWDVAPDGSGGATAVGGTAESNANTGFAVTLSPDGSERWRQTYRPNGVSDQAGTLRFVTPAHGEGFVMGGTRFGANEAWVLRTDAEGNPILNRTYDLGGNDIPLGGVAVPGGGYLGVGASFVDQGFVGWAVRVEATGDIGWVDRPADPPSSLSDVTSVGDQFVAAGNKKTDGSYRGWLVAYSASGEVQWQRTFGSKMFFNSVTVRGNGDVVVAGNIGQDRTDAFAMAVTADGDPQWQRTVDAAATDDAQAAAPTPDGGALFAGTARAENQDAGRGLLFKLDADGNETWQTTVDAPGGFYGMTGVDRGYVTVGPGREAAVSAKVAAANRPPEVSIQVATDQPTVGQPVTLRADASDPDGQVASVEWDAGADGSVDAEGQEATVTFSSAGEHTVRATAVDDRGAATSTEVTIRVRKAFDPTVHGFGFSNWDRGGSADHDHRSVSVQQVRDQMDRAWPQQVARSLDVDYDSLSGDLLDTIATASQVALEQGRAVDSHSLGMAIAARQYFADPSRVPGDATSAADLGSPAAGGGAVGGRIDEVHNGQYALFANWLIQFRVLAGDVAVDGAAQREAVVDALDERGTAVLLLGTGDGATERIHAVLAYDYVQEGGQVRVPVYDPDATASDHAGDADVAVDVEVAGDVSYEQACYLPVAGRVTVPELVEADRETLASFAEGAAAFMTKSPVDVEVTADGETLPSLWADGAATAPTEYEDLVVGFGAPPSSYDISLTGTGDGEYVLVARAADAGGTVLDTTASGSISQGATHAFVAETSPDGGDGTLSRTGGGLSIPGVGTVDLAKYEGLLVPVGGGVALLGGYAAYRHFRSDEPDFETRRRRRRRKVQQQGRTLGRDTPGGDGSDRDSGSGSETPDRSGDADRDRTRTPDEETGTGSGVESGTETGAATGAEPDDSGAETGGDTTGRDESARTARDETATTADAESAERADDGSDQSTAGFGAAAGDGEDRGPEEPTEPGPETGARTGTATGSEAESERGSGTGADEGVGADGDTGADREESDRRDADGDGAASTPDGASEGAADDGAGATGGLPPDMQYCPHCGEEVSRDANFCRFCGGDL